VSELTDWDIDSGELPYKAQLHRTALRLTRSWESAEDLLQDTYLKAFRHYGSFRRGTNLKAWLFKILKNTFINDYRRRQRTPTLVAFAHIETTQKSAVASLAGSVTRTPEDEVVEAVLDGEVRQALAELPHAYKVVVLLADLEGHAYREIAAILEIPVGTVMSRLYRGRRLLERALLSFGVRYHYLLHRPRRLRSADLDLERFFGAAAAPAETGPAGDRVVPT
jgi:RNA polymerase sigma-70 factor (ECF subfamily)